METVTVKRRGWARRLFAFAGPAYLVSVGYMDPGNWATDIEAGARFGYALMWVLLLSNGMALLLQTLSVRLGVVTGFDLAQGCRREYPRPVSAALWVLAELAIVATDLAEVLGTILGLNLLFGLPLLWGCAITACDTFLLLAIQRLGVRRMEAFILMLVGTVAGCFLVEVFLARPDWGAAAAGLRPSLPPGALFVAIGIIGATVMPHNLYLHSSLVQSRGIDRTRTARAEACRYNLVDSIVALNGAFFVNSAILLVSAATFFRHGRVVEEIQQAHAMLNGLVGSNLAQPLFGIALLAAGQSSTLTGTLSGQVVMEGFVNLRLQPWVRRLVTRGLALIPATIVIALAGSHGTYRLLILSQVVLSLQLPFAVIPLVQFTSQREKMGSFASALWLRLLAWMAAAVIAGLNIWLVVDTLGEVLPRWPLAAGGAAVAVAVALAALLVWLCLAPLTGRRREWQTDGAAPGAAVVRRMRPPVVRNVGVALETGEGDADVLAMAVSLARSHRSRLTLLHVIESPGGMVYGAESESLHTRQDQAYFEALAREIEDADLPVEVLLRTGQPVPEIVAAVREVGVDLLVMGTHGHRGVQDVVFGTTVSGVRHALAIPVVLVRAKAAESTTGGC